jgi:Icc-related predicted phosphoesterase
MLNIPLFYVKGNHANQVEEGVAGSRVGPMGGINLHRRSVVYQNKIIAGLQGCLQYNFGPMQYSQAEYWSMAILLSVGLLQNKLILGRYLDILVTHAPPKGIHDQSDRPHQGIQAFTWLDKVFQPAIHFHGHIHVYRNDTRKESIYHKTRVINTFGYRETVIQ